VISLRRSDGQYTDKVGIPFATHEDYPDGMAEMEEAVEEQRRLLYVAGTRASSQLVLSYSGRMELALAQSLRMEIAGQGIRKSGAVISATTIPSRFLRELGPEAPAVIPGSRWLASYL
jgi:superfamily I DNA/RNA helicase